MVPGIWQMDYVAIHPDTLRAQARVPEQDGNPIENLERPVELALLPGRGGMPCGSLRPGKPRP